MKDEGDKWKKDKKACDWRVEIKIWYYGLVPDILHYYIINPIWWRHFISQLSSFSTSTIRVTSFSTLNIVVVRGGGSFFNFLRIIILHYLSFILFFLVANGLFISKYMVITFSVCHIYKIIIPNPPSSFFPGWGWGDLILL